MFKIVHCCFFGVVGDAIVLGLWPTLAEAFNFMDPAVLCTYPLYCDGNIPLRITGIHLNTWGRSGTLPDSIGLLSNLLWLDLYNNNLTGKIPDSLGQLSNLAYLLLNTNNLSGIIPDSIGLLSNLQYLYLSSNNLSGTISNSLGQLRILRYLYLDGNNISGGIPTSLSSSVCLFVGDGSEFQFLDWQHS